MAQDDRNADTPSEVTGGPSAPQDGTDGLQGPSDTPDPSEDAQDQVRAKVVYPMSGHFIPGDGLPEVPPEGVLVSREVADRIKAKAKDAGVTISARKE